VILLSEGDTNSTPLKIYALMTGPQCNQPKYSIMDYFPKPQQHKGLAWRSSCRCENIPVSKFMVLKVPSILWNMQMAQHCTSTHPCWLFFQRQWNTSCPLIINSKDSKTSEYFPNGSCPIKFLTKQTLILKESSHDLKLSQQCFQSNSIIDIWHQVITLIWMINVDISIHQDISKLLNDSLVNMILPILAKCKWSQPGSGWESS